MSVLLEMRNVRRARKDLCLPVMDHVARLREVERTASCHQNTAQNRFALGTLQSKFNKLKAQSEHKHVVKTPFDRMQDCRDALTKLDNCGWMRSYHQRLFHEDFLVRCVCDLQFIIFMISQTFSKSAETPLSDSR